MRISSLVCALAALLVAGVPPAHAQSSGTWRIVEACAMYAPARLAEGEYDAESAWLNAGETVLLVDEGPSGTVVMEHFGRVSVVTPSSCLTTPPPGRPAQLAGDIQTMSRRLSTGASVWVTSIDPATETAAILIDGGERLTVPVAKVLLIGNSYLPMTTMRPVAR